jgi:hypothetical protein
MSGSVPGQLARACSGSGWSCLPPPTLSNQFCSENNHVDAKTVAVDGCSHARTNTLAATQASSTLQAPPTMSY